MEMKINLDKIFGTTKTDESIIDFKTQDFHHSQIQSSQNFDIRYHLNMPLFDDPDKTQEYHKSTNTQIFKSSSIKIEQNSDFKDSMPGERLYYESQNNFMRKKQEMQKLKQEQQIEERKNITFKPLINKKSEQILSHKATKSSHLDKKKSQKLNEISTADKRLHEQEKQCTFKPHLISKTTKNTKKREKDKVFEGLFNDHKVKQAKAKLLFEEEEIKKRQNIREKTANFQKFLNRNNQFRNKVNKKQQLIAKTSKKYDLNSGKKMFTPETCSYTPKASRNQKYFEGLNNEVQSFKPKSIFEKNVSVERQELFEVDEKEKLSFHETFPIDEQQEEQQVLQEPALTHIHGQTTNMEGKLSKLSQFYEDIEQKEDRVEELQHQTEKSTENIENNQ